MDRNSTIPSSGSEFIERKGFIAENRLKVFCHVVEFPIDLVDDEPLEGSSACQADRRGRQPGRKDQDESRFGCHLEFRPSEHFTS
jgi:hypothetical protein